MEGGWLVRARGIYRYTSLGLHDMFLHSDTAFCGQLALGQNEDLPVDVYDFQYNLSEKICLPFGLRCGGSEV